ncbi:uncharacterized protein LOC143359852 [Halictus rubicundus]|uniref:uncharacterized protein LOC143359852 n=1 Tax=Halictus rubicundus TaxID=77578 RepID=UPI004036B0C3
MIPLCSTIQCFCYSLVQRVQRKALSGNQSLFRNINPPKRKMAEPKEWYSIIEDILQCPVCLTIGETSYIHCLRGHHMCGYCIQSITKCPMCNGELLPKSIKHLVSDDLASKLDEIQLSIDEDIKSSNTKSQQDQSVQTDFVITNSSVDVQTDETNYVIAAKLSVYTQTYNDHFHKPNNSNLKKQIRNGPRSYPCLICWCFANFSYKHLEEHLKQCHKHILQEEHELSNVCMKTFSVQCNKLPWECDHALLIDNKAVIFVNFIVRSSGCFKCSVQCIKVDHLLPILNYTIIVAVDPKLKYTGKVKPYEAEHNLKDFDVCFNAESMSSILKTKSFTFTFSINHTDPASNPI